MSAAQHANTMAALRVSGVHVHLGLSHVLQGVDVEVMPGEVVGLFGRNGVGKTTIVKTIAGWVAPSAGSIEVFGQRLAGRASDEICRAGVGLVPEDRRIFPGLTVHENLHLGLMQTPRMPPAERQRRFESIYTRFPRLAERRRQMGTTLSGGEQQMLAMARVLMGKPRLLLIDEPTEGLAPMIVDDLFALMSSLRDDGLSILLVEQNLRRALALTDRYYAIERGQVVLTGRASDASDRERLMAQLAV